MNDLPKAIANRLAEEFADREYAHAYMEEHAVSRIAAQVYALRMQRGWTQTELARRSRIAQERISMIESADFESLTMKTLYKLASAFDVVANVDFHSFGDAILDVVNLSEDQLQVADREKSLDQFCKSKLIKLGAGWKSINPDDAAVNVVFLRSSDPVDPSASQNWVRLGHG